MFRRSAAPKACGVVARAAAGCGTARFLRFRHSAVYPHLLHDARDPDGLVVSRGRRRCGRRQRGCTGRWSPRRPLRFPALRHALPLLSLVLRDRGGDLVRDLIDVRLVQREVEHIGQCVGHLGTGNADGKHPHALAAQLTGDGEREFLPTPVRLSRCLADQSEEEIDFGDCRRDSLDEGVSDFELALIDPDAEAASVERCSERTGEILVLVGVGDEDRGL